MLGVAYTVTVTMLDLAFDRLCVRFTAVRLSCNDSGQVVHTHTHLPLLSSSSITWSWSKWWLMPCGWEG